MKKNSENLKSQIKDILEMFDALENYRNEKLKMLIEFEGFHKIYDSKYINVLYENQYPESQTYHKDLWQKEPKDLIPKSEKYLEMLRVFNEDGGQIKSLESFCNIINIYRS